MKPCRKYIAFSITLFIWIITNSMVRAQENWKNFELAQLHQRRVESKRTFLPFLNEQSFRAGLYELKAKIIDDQPVHDEDEIYFINSGRAKLLAGDSTLEAVAGAVLFVKAGVSHRFVEIEEDLSTTVIFSQSPSQPGDPDAMAWNLSQLRSSAKENENVWEQFLFVSTMRMGLYMLPKEIGGDKPLTHKVDEINIVTKGTAIFVVGEDRIPVREGSIVWVSQENPHHFQELSEDFEVLITFHIKP